jgi:hypothetical protein
MRHIEKLLRTCVHFQLRKGLYPTLFYGFSAILGSVPIVYVQLLNEGTVVYRPTNAIFLDTQVAILDPDEYDPDDEEWEFKPGSVVRVETKELQGGPVPVAVKLVDYGEKGR